MFHSSLPPLKVPNGQSSQTKPSLTLWALRPSAAQWNRLPSLCSTSSRAQFVLDGLANNSAASLTSWSNSNVIAFGSPEPYYVHNNDQQTESCQSWPLYLILPDQPAETYLVKEFDRPLLTVSWHPTIPNLLMTATSSSISLFTPPVENVLNSLEQTASFPTKHLMLCRWVHVPIKFKVETPQAMWNQPFSLGRKFAADKPAATPSPYAKASCVGLSHDGSVYWIYMSASNSKWNVMRGQLKDGPFLKADICFQSYNTARILVVPSQAPNVILVYQVYADFVANAVTLVPQATSRLEIPSETYASFYFRHSTNRSSFSSQWLLNESLASSTAAHGTAQNMAAAAAAAANTTTRGNGISGVATNPVHKDEAPTWLLAHLTHTGESCIQHALFDPYDPTIIFLVWVSGKTLSNGNRASILQKWKSTTQTLKFKCPFDITPYIMDSSDTSMPQDTDMTSTNVGESHSGMHHSESMHDPHNAFGSASQHGNHVDEFGTSMNEFDDMNMDSNLSADYDMWGFGDTAAKPASAPSTQTQHHSSSDANQRGEAQMRASTSNPSDPFGAASSGAGTSSNGLDSSQIIQGGTNSSIFEEGSASNSLRSSSLETEVWEVSNRLLIPFVGPLTGSLASSTTLTQSQGFATTTTTPGAPLNASNNSSAPLPAQMDSVTSIKCYRNVIVLTTISGSTWLFDAETMEAIMEHSLPHQFCATPAVKLGSSSSKISGNAANSTLNTASGDSLAKISRKRSLDFSPGGWSHDFVTSPYSPHLPFPGYEFNAQSPTGPPIKRMKMEEPDDKTIDLAALDPTSNFHRHASGFVGVVSSKVPVDFCMSPNQACLALLYSDLTVRTFHLSPLLKHRTSVVTPQQLCMQLSNMFEVAMLQRRTHWDVLALLLALNNEETPNSAPQHLHRGVLVLLSRDIEKLDPKGSGTPSWWRIELEVIKSAIYRSSPDMTYNFMRSQSQLSLRRVIHTLSMHYRCGAWLRRIMDATVATDHPETKSLFVPQDPSNERPKIEKEDPSTPAPIYSLKWIQALTHWIIGTVEGFHKRLKQLREQKDIAASNASSSSTNSATSQFFTSENSIHTAGSGAYAESPALMGHTPTLHTPSTTTHTPNAASIHTPHRMFDSPHGSTPHSTTTPHPPPLPNRHAGQSVLLSLPSWFSQLPISPESLEELLLICPDENVDVGLLWMLDIPLIRLMKEAILYFTVALHLDKVHASGAEYIKQFPLPAFATFHEILNSQAATLLSSSIKYMTEDWITGHVIPTFYLLKEPPFRPMTADLQALDLTPVRMRFLEMNFFTGEPIDPASFPLRDGKTFATTTTTTSASSSSSSSSSSSMTPPQRQGGAANSVPASKTFWMAVGSPLSSGIPQAPDSASLTEIKGEYCKRCVVCNRTSALHHRASDGSDPYKSCTVCHGSWMIVRNPFLPVKRTVSGR